jgi:hypothetical protein
MTRVRRRNACSILNFSGIFLEKLDYKIHFRRKLWIDIIPGEDKQADSMIHFYQERDNYLLGLQEKLIVAEEHRSKLKLEINANNFIDFLEQISRILYQVI